MEKIRAYAKAPWIPPVKVSISHSKLEAIQQAKSYQGPAVFTDASLRNDLPELEYTGRISTFRISH